MWDEAIELFSAHQSREVFTFLGRDCVKKASESFQTYCQAPVQGERQQFGMLSHNSEVGSGHMLNVMELPIQDFEHCSTQYY